MTINKYEKIIEDLIDEKFPFIQKLANKTKGKISIQLFEKIIRIIFNFALKNSSTFEKVIERPDQSTTKFKTKFSKEFKNKYPIELYNEIEASVISFIQYAPMIKAAIKENPDKELIKIILNIEKTETEIKKDIFSAFDKAVKQTPAMEFILANSYNDFKKSFEHQMRYLKIINMIFKEAETKGLDIKSLFDPTSGRPNDLLLNALLSDLVKFAKSNYPKAPFAKLCKPVLFFTAKHYPSMIDINDVKTWDLIRKRIEYQNKPKKRVEKKKKISA